MQLDRKAAEIVLRSLKQAIPSRWAAKVDELRRLATQVEDPGLAHYLVETGLELSDVYTGSKSWSDLRSAAGLSLEPAGPHEIRLRRAIGRLLHVAARERIDTYRALLAGKSAPSLHSKTERERRLARMLAAQLGDQVFGKEVDLESGYRVLWQHPQVRAEAAELLQLLGDRIDHLHPALDQRSD